jgi:hypothetical protein
MVIFTDNFDKNKYVYTKKSKTANPAFRYNLPTKVIVIGTDNKPSEDIWIARYNQNYCLDLINAIKSKKVNKENKDNYDNTTIQDIVWRLWLCHKFSANNIKCTIPGYFYSYVNENKNEKSELENTNNKCFDITFDDHGKNIQQHFISKKCKNGHFEAYSSLIKLSYEKSIIKTKLENKEMILDSNHDFQTMGLYKIDDAILNNILIVDERVQLAYSKDFEYRKNYTIKDVMKACNIFVPSENLNLNKDPYDSNYEEILKKEIQQIKNESSLKSELNYVVIHLGVIEKILTRSGRTKGESKILEFINNLENCLVNDDNNTKIRVIATSGRGKPDNLPSGVPFLPYSILSQYAIEIRFKSFLNQAIQLAKPLIYNN